MPKDFETRLEHLEAQMRAQQNIVLSAIVAAGFLVPSLADATLEQIEIQRDVMRADGLLLQALFMDDAIRSIRTVLDLPADD